MTGIRALLVDFDGTLADTASANFNAYRQALVEHNVEIDRKTFEKFALGRHWSAFLPDLAPTLTSTDHARIARRKATIYQNHIPSVRMNTALLRLLTVLRPNCKIALVSTARAAALYYALEHHRFLHIFDVVITGDDVKRHKPDPECFHLAAARLGIEPAECLVIEDSDVGVEAAIAFGGEVLRIAIVPSPGTPSHG